MPVDSSMAVAMVAGLATAFGGGILTGFAVRLLRKGR